MQQSRRATLEICVDSAAGIAACAQGVDRIELCSGLSVGGLTPSPGMMRLAKDSGLETHVLIRPRSGIFEFDAHDIAVACADIEAVRSFGLHGVVIGVAKDGALDLPTMRALISHADGLSITLHRVIDVLTDQMTALEHAIELGMSRILTSGGAVSALVGAAQIARLHNAAHGRIEIMAGAGINAQTVLSVAKRTGVCAFHASCKTAVPTPQGLQDYGFGATQYQFDEKKLSDLTDAIRLL